MTNVRFGACRALALAVALAASALAPAGAVRAERVLIDRIVALVDDEAIFQSDIEEMVRQYMFAQRISSLTEEQKRQFTQRALEDLINDKLILAEAARLDIDVPFSEVEKRVDEAIEENRKLLGGDEAFQRQLEREGLTLDKLKALYRRQWKNRLLVERVLRQQMPQTRRQPSDDELRAFFEEHRSEIPPRPAVVHLRTIFLPFDAVSSVGDEARRRIEEIYAKLQAGASFEELAKKYSEDPSAPLGGDLGFVRPEDLAEPAFRDAVRRLSPGQVSEPVRTTYGWHVIRVTEARPDGEVHVGHILVRAKASEKDVEAAFRKITAIRDSILAGADFGEMARRWNADPAAGDDGDLGWLRVNDLPQYFRDLLQGLQPGQVSQALRESSGFRIVQMVEREESRPWAFDEIRGELVRMWQQEQLAKSYEEYIEQLRKKFTVVLHTS